MASAEDVEEIKSKVNALATARYGNASALSIKKLFAEYDLDKNSLANQSEIARLFNDADVDVTRAFVHVPNSTVASAVIDEMDQNADRQIAWEEYKAYMGIVEPTTGGGDGKAPPPTGGGGGGSLYPPFVPKEDEPLGAPAAQIAKRSSWGYWPWVGLGVAVAGVVAWRRRAR